MDRFQLQKLRDLPIEGVAERLGLTVTRHKCLCPFHDDHHASLSFKVSKNTFRCFVCGASGGTIDLVMRYLNKDFRDACRWLADEHNVIIEHSPFLRPDGSKRPSAERSIDQYDAQKAFDASRYNRYFERPWLSDEARRFLFEERRLDERVVRWCRLTSWRDRQGVPWLQIPYYDRQGKLVGVQNRNLRPPSGSPEVPLSNSPEGECPKASPRGGLEGVPGLEGVLSFHMYPDRDEPGERLFMQLKEVLPALEHHQLPPGCKDYSEYYLSKLRGQASG